jgi:hypothetical protein
MSGDRIMSVTDGDRTCMADGSGPITDGIGFRVSRLDGQRFTTAAGSMMIIMDGFGFPMTCGDQHGLNGGTAMIISAGRRYLLVHTSIFPSASRSMSVGMRQFITGILSHAEVSHR